MKNFLKNLNYPFILFFLYLVKSVLLPANLIDVYVLSIIGLLVIGDKFLTKCGKGVDEYFETKNRVISENEFRLQVSNDMGRLDQAIQEIKLQSGAGFQNLGGGLAPKRR